MTMPDPAVLRLAQAAATALARRDHAGAEMAARRLLALNPRDPNAHQVLGVIALDRGNAAAAKRAFEVADQAAPNQPHILNGLGVALRRLEEADNARAAFTRAAELGLVDAWRNLGNLEAAEQRSSASIAAFERVLAHNPNDAAALAGLAHAHEQRHDLARATEYAAAALAREPGNEVAQLVLAHVKLRERDLTGAEAAALPVTRGASKTNAAVAWGVIGEARDKSGDTSGAFAAFTAANQALLAEHGALLNASHLLYHPDGVARMAALAERVDVEAWTPKSGFATPAPVFLIGFPRSGTTLLDQILCAHPRLVCIEEREHFGRTLANAIPDPGKLARLAALTADEIEAARADYWSRVKADTKDWSEEQVLIDKLPLNIVVLPLIKRFFPDAKLILALRDPRDVILSCYQQRFGINAAMVRFLDLNTSAEYYDRVMSLMELARRKLALELHEVRYERVVADLEAEARALAEFIGVGFDPQMLDYRAKALAREIGTPSARQVVQPLYTHSISRWRRYQAQLEPVLPVLNPWAERYGYSL